MQLSLMPDIYICKEQRIITFTYQDSVNLSPSTATKKVKKLALNNAAMQHSGVSFFKKF